MTASNSSSLVKGALLIALAAGYYIGLGLMPAITYKLPINDLAEWLGASRSVSAYAYLIGTHTIGVILAAVPIALILAFVYADRVMLLAFLITLPPVIDLVFGLWMFSGIGELRSVPQTIFYITDILKIGSAVPVFSWLFSRYLPYNNRMQRTRQGQSA